MDTAMHESNDRDVPHISIQPIEVPDHIQWSPACCGMSLSNARKTAQADDHLRVVHEMIMPREGRKVTMNCRWPGCKAAFQVQHAGKHLLDAHIDPEGKSGKRGPNISDM